MTLSILQDVIEEKFTVVNRILSHALQCSLRDEVLGLINLDEHHI